MVHYFDHRTETLKLLQGNEANIVTVRGNVGTLVVAQKGETKEGFQRIIKDTRALDVLYEGSSNVDGGTGPRYESGLDPKITDDSEAKTVTLVPILTMRNAVNKITLWVSDDKWTVAYLYFYYMQQSSKVFRSYGNVRVVKIVGESHTQPLSEITYHDKIPLLSKIYKSEVILRRWTDDDELRTTLTPDMDYDFDVAADLPEPTHTDEEDNSKSTMLTPQDDSSKEESSTEEKEDSDEEKEDSNEEKSDTEPSDGENVMFATDIHPGMIPNPNVPPDSFKSKEHVVYPLTDTDETYYRKKEEEGDKETLEYPFEAILDEITDASGENESCIDYGSMDPPGLIPLDEAGTDPIESDAEEVTLTLRPVGYVTRKKLVDHWIKNVKSLPTVDAVLYSYCEQVSDESVRKTTFRFLANGIGSVYRKDSDGSSVVAFNVRDYSFQRLLGEEKSIDLQIKKVPLLFDDWKNLPNSTVSSGYMDYNVNADKELLKDPHPEDLYSNYKLLIGDWESNHLGLLFKTKTKITNFRIVKSKLVALYLVNEK